MPAVATSSEAGNFAPTLAGTDARDLRLNYAKSLREHYMRFFASHNLKNLFLRKRSICDAGWNSSQGLLDGSIKFIQAIPQRSLTYAEVPRPRCERLGFPFIRDQITVALVAILFERSSPSQVSGFVIPIVFDSFQAHTVWPFSNDLQKTLQGSQLWRDRNSSTAIIRIFRASVIETPTHHVVPDLIFGGSGQAIMRIRFLVSIKTGDSIVIAANAPLNDDGFRNVQSTGQRGEHLCYFWADFHAGLSMPAAINKSELQEVKPCLPWPCQLQ